jgi:hypothetical protein
MSPPMMQAETVSEMLNIKLHSDMADCPRRLLHLYIFNRLRYTRGSGME